MRLQMLGRDAVAGVDHFHARAVSPQVRTSSTPPPLHGVARVQEQVQKDLLQLAGVAVDRRPGPDRDRSSPRCPPSAIDAPAATAFPESPG
jgi:hypothetical protein